MFVLAGACMGVALLAFSTIGEDVLCDSYEVFLAIRAEQVVRCLGEVAISPMIERQVNTLTGCPEGPTINVIVTLDDEL